MIDQQLYNLFFATHNNPNTLVVLKDYLDRHYPYARRFFGESTRVHGVGILYYPAGDPRAEHIAIDVVDKIRVGTVIQLPNTRDFSGNYAWEFKIVGGDLDQVKVERREPIKR